MLLLPVLAALCFSRDRRRRRARGVTRSTINPAIFGNLLDDTFDAQLEKTVNKGVRRGDRRPQQLQQAPQFLLRPDFEQLLSQKLEHKQRRYRALLNAARAIMNAYGVRYQTKGSEFQKNLEALVNELVEPKL